MKRPMPPPGITQLSKAALEVLRAVAFKPLSAQDEYLPWDKLRYRQPPEGLSHEEWWVILKVARNVQKRELPLRDKSGEAFSYVLPDNVLRAVENITRSASGNISISEQVTNPATRDR